MEDLRIVKKRFRLLKLKRYWELPYEIRIDVGPAEVNFQLWFNGKPRGSEGDVSVDFMEAIREDARFATTYAQALGAAPSVPIQPGQN